jgi:hypothetical protein
MLGAGLRTIGSAKEAAGVSVKLEYWSKRMGA